jgi:hypothetical protein
LLESVVNFSGRDVFSNEEFDHNALFQSENMKWGYTVWISSSCYSLQGSGPLDLFCGYTNFLNDLIRGSALKTSEAGLIASRLPIWSDFPWHFCVLVLCIMLLFSVVFSKGAASIGFDEC